MILLIKILNVEFNIFVFCDYYQKHTIINSIIVNFSVKFYCGHIYQNQILDL